VSVPLVSGLTIIRNGVRLNYPFLEAIRSALSICDEYIVVAGDSDDETLEALASLNDDRVRVIHTEWSPLVQPRKYLLAQQTNIGIGFCRGRWCLYLQGNEVLHEKDLPRLRELMETHAENAAVEAMLVERLTFWGDYRHYVAAYPRRFKYTARIIRPHIGTYSIRDGMSFAVFDDFSTKGRYPNAIDTGADLYRYDYVHTVEQQARKFADAVHRAGTDVRADPDYFTTYYPRQFLARFEGTHPAVMNQRIADWPQGEGLDLESCRTQLTPGERKRLVESYWYDRFGLPKTSRNRFKLVGGFQDKERPELGVFNGTLKTRGE
jgi:glycosyltransferase involved in cell wall biosynthesis